MNKRHVIFSICSALLATGGYQATARADLTHTECTVSKVGWRETIGTLVVECGDTTFYNRETTANPDCQLKTPLDSIKILQTLADASLLSGKTVEIYYELQSGCGPEDPVIREMFLRR